MRFGATRSRGRLGLEVQQLWILSAIAKRAREQHLEAAGFLELTGAAGQADWDRYLARLDEAGAKAAARVIRAHEAATKGGRIARIREAIQGSLAGDDEDAGSTRPSFMYVLGAGPRTILSLWELPPCELGNAYHHRLCQTQLVLVLDGRPTLCSREARRELQEQEAVVFLGEEDDHHELINGKPQSVRFLTLSTRDQASLVF
jgi:hypothetical protein